MTVDFGAANKKPEPLANLPELVEPATPVLSLEPIRDALAVYGGLIQEMAAQAESLAVDSHESNLAAVEMAGQVKKLGKTLEEGRVKYTKPANEHVKGINGLIKPFQTKLTIIEAGLKAKISQHQARVELEQRKAEEVARKAQAELQAKLEADAKAAGVEAPKLEPAVIAKADPVARTESGTAYQRKTWEFEIEDDRKVPETYKIVSEQLIRAAVRAGVRQIPGVKIYQKTQTQIRG